MDDIDKLRDDLQSTKQMLAQELRNKEAQERENKRLLAKIQNLEAELSKPKSEGGGESGGEVKNGSSGGGDNDALVKSLKNEAEQAQNTSKLLEKKYQDAASQLDAAKSEVEEQKHKIAELEKKLAQTQVTTSIPLLASFSCIFFSFGLSMLRSIFSCCCTKTKRRITSGAAIAIALNQLTLMIWYTHRSNHR